MALNTEEEKLAQRDRMIQVEASLGRDLISDEFISHHSRTGFQSLSEVLVASGAQDVKQLLRQENSRFLSEEFGCNDWWHFVCIAEHFAMQGGLP